MTDRFRIVKSQLVWPYWLIPERVMCWFCYHSTRWIDAHRLEGEKAYGWWDAVKTGIRCARQHTDDPMRIVERPGMKGSWKGLLIFIPAFVVSLLFWWLIYTAIVT